MKYVALLILLLASTAAAADFESAADAYRRKDYNTAFEGFSELARGGDPRAQTVLALMYKYGESVDQDLGKAFELYLSAAESGYTPAQFYVGEMLAEGRGVEHDEAAAIEWLTRAAESGFERANELLSNLNAPQVVDGKRVDPSVPWSKAWNFRLPNNIRYKDAGNIGAIEPSALYNVQLGAMGTQAGANRLWDWLTTQAPGLFGEIDPIIKLAQPPEQSSNRRIYRVQAGPFNSLAEARTFCDQVTQRIRGADCLPLKQL